MIPKPQMHDAEDGLDQVRGVMFLAAMALEEIEARNDDVDALYSIRCALQMSVKRIDGIADFLNEISTGRHGNLVVGER